MSASLLADRRGLSMRGRVFWAGVLVLSLSLVTVPAYGATPTPPSSVTLSATKTVVRSDETSTLTATANRTVTGTGTYIRIYDKTAGVYLATCSSGATCQTSVQILNGGPHKYVAYVGDTGSAAPPGHLKATSSVVTISRAAWTVGLATTSTSLRSDETATLTATTNQTVSGTG